MIRRQIDKEPLHSTTNFVAPLGMALYQIRNRSEMFEACNRFTRSVTPSDLTEEAPGFVLRCKRSAHQSCKFCVPCKGVIAAREAAIRGGAADLSGSRLSCLHSD